MAETPSPMPSQIGFLHPLLPSVSLTNISNLAVEPYNKDSQMIRAIMGELVSVFKDIAQLQPIFREQSKLNTAMSEVWAKLSHIIHHVQFDLQRV